MVCFDILLSVRVHSKKSANAVNDIRFKHMCKHYNVEILNTYTEDRVQYRRVIACDEDAVAILYDIPSPMVCVSVKIYRSDTVLYQNSKVTHKKSIPPRETLLKRVYWMASSLERRLLSTHSQ